MIESVKAKLSELQFNLFGGRGNLSQLIDDTAIQKEKALPDHKCVELSRLIDQLLTSKSTSVKIWADPQGSDHRIWKFEEHIKEYLSTFAIDEKIKDINKYLGMRQDSWTIMANRVTAIENNLGSGGGWHRDSPHSHQIKMIWYLSDVEKINGPFEYLPNTHLLNHPDNKKYKVGEYRFPSVHSKSKLATGKMGDLLICDTKAIHRGKPIETGVRYAMTLYTFKNDTAKQNFLNAI